VSQPQSSPSMSPISEVYPLLGRYQQHVHHLEPGTEPQRFIERESTLQSGIPDDLRQFLLIHNGAVLFDGDLCIRSLSALSVAAANHPEVVCFAQMNVMVNPLNPDGVQTEHWAYIIDVHGQGCYGLWEKGTFTPLYRDFQDWLLSNIQLLVDGTFPSAFQKRKMLANNPIFFEATHIEQWLATGQFDRAATVLGELIQELPTPRYWMDYAVCLQSIAKPGWESALLESIRSLHFPLSHIGALPTSKTWLTDITKQVPVLQTSVEEILEVLWTDEIPMLSGFLSSHDLQMLEQIAIVLCHDRTGSQLSFTDFIDQFNRWNPQFVPSRLMLSQIDRYIQQDLHDPAESLIFCLLRRDETVEAACLLRLARIVVTRHEPWGLHILFDLLETDPDVSIQAEAWLLATQYCLDNEQFDRAVSFLESVKSLHDVESESRLSGWYWQLSAVLAHQKQRLGDSGKLFLKAVRLTLPHDLYRLGQIAVCEAEFYQTMQQPDSANTRFETAMHYFSRLNASLSMAETLLHWGRLTGSQQHFQQAATLFQQVGFASGLSVVDQYLTGKRKAWSWYLETTKELVQRWVQYRRSQGRGVRQEADNPERRLYGLKMAVADSPIDIVNLLWEQVEASRTVIERDLVTQSHEQYAYFVAGIELLLAHSSQPAHDSILYLVRSSRLDTVAIEALMQSLSRTRNVSMVESLRGLLVVTEPISAQWIATHVLGERRDKNSIEKILALLESSEDVRIQRSCLLALGRLGDATIIPTLDAYGDIPELMEHWATALLLLGDDIAIHQLAGQLSEGKLGNQSVLGHLVGRYGGTTNLLLLRKMADSNDSVNVSAIHGLGYLGDTRAIQVLLEMTGLRDRSKATAASHALELLTGHHENTEDYLLRARWQSWLDDHTGWISNVRYRHGVPMSPAQLILDLGHDDRLVRSSSYDELVIMTGVALSFDVDGSWRRQKAQISAWNSWWDTQRSTYSVGQWVLHGKTYC
jgi:HEAT repeat protein